MNKTGIAVLSIIASGLCGFSQAPEQPGPSELSPKQMPPPEVHGKAQIQQKSLRSPSGDKPLNPDKPNLTIKGIVIVNDKTKIQEAGATPMTGLDVKDVIFPLDNPDFRAMVEKGFIGKPLTENNIRDLQDAIILYFRKHGKILVDVILPEQNIENGVLQLWVLEGRVGKITVKNEGTKWFKDQLFLDSVRLRPNQELDGKKFNDDLNWINNNPFRQVDVSFKPGEKLGLTDVQLNVEDRLPLRPYFGYEDSGTKATGPDRFLFGVNWGNAFGLDHQFNYQYATDTEFDFVRAHSASYVMPLPWHHTLLVYGSYIDAKADLQGAISEGSSWQTSLRYAVPLPQVQKYKHQISGGFDFKRSDNSLLSGGTAFVTNDTDIAQFALEYTGLLPDPWGRTSLGLEGYYSPGGMTEFNTSQDFNGLRARATSYYLYFRANAERITRLPVNFSWVLRGSFQYTPEQRLLPSEQLAIGGYSTIRGYDERVLLGDSGWVINNELRTPPFHLTDYIHLPVPRDELQFLTFFDYGGVRINQHRAEDDLGTISAETELYSAGVGLRYAVGSHVSFRFDYGYPFNHSSQTFLTESRNGRVHIGLLLGF